MSARNTADLSSNRSEQRMHDDHSKQSTDLSRRGFIGAGALSAVGFTSLGNRLEHWGSADHERHAEALHRVAAFELEEVSISDLQAGMTSGKYTARSLVEEYLSRIDALDQKGPALNHLIELNPD